MAGGDDPTTGAGALNLKRILAFLPMAFGVIGILEKWDETTALLDCSLPLKGGTWKVLSSKHTVTHSTSTFEYKKKKDNERDLLNETRESPAVRATLAGDIAIYEAAKNIFETRLKAHSTKALECSPFSFGPGVLRRGDKQTMAPRARSIGPL